MPELRIILKKGGLKRDSGLSRHPLANSTERLSAQDASTQQYYDS
jgi:hypothetical protein